MGLGEITCMWREWPCYLHQDRTPSLWIAVCCSCRVTYSCCWPVDGGCGSGDKIGRLESSEKKNMRSEGRLSPQRPRRLRSAKRSLPKLYPAHSKPAKAETPRRQAEKPTTTVRHPVSL